MKKRKNVKAATIDEERLKNKIIIDETEKDEKKITVGMI